MLTITSSDRNNSVLSWLKLKRRFFLILLIILVLAVFWFIYSNPLLVTVSGSSELFVSPDEARVSFLLSSPDSGPDGAINNLKSRSEQIKKTLASFGVSEEDIVQGQILVSPPMQSSPSPSAFTASVSMEVKLKDVSKVMPLVSSLYKNGASYVFQPILAVKDAKMYEKKVIDMAVDDATKTADNVGRSQRKFLRRRITLSYSLVSPSTPTASRSTAGTQGSFPVGGQFTDSLRLNAVVTVTYKMWGF